MGQQVAGASRRDGGKLEADDQQESGSVDVLLVAEAGVTGESHLDSFPALRADDLKSDRLPHHTLDKCGDHGVHVVQSLVEQLQLLLHLL